MTDQPTITLSQWCAYLPYDIQIKHEKFERAAKLTAAKIENIINSPEFAAKIKPLLRRPHFDIQKIIDEVYNSKVNWRIRIDYDYTYNRFYNEDITIEIEHLPNSIVQALLAAHYDIFNLIPQGLALQIE